MDDGCLQKTVLDGDEWRQRLQEMNFDERVQATIDCLDRRSTFRDILYGLLDFCSEEKSYEEIELYVETFPEFHRNRQQARRYVFMLLRTGALEEIELGENGQPLIEADKQAAIEDGLDPEDVDVLVFDWRVATTDVGKRAYEDYRPMLRFQKLLAEDPDGAEALIKIMRFCQKPRFMGQIDDEFKGSALLGFDAQSSQMRQPSSYMEKLEHAGMVSWNNQFWVLTENGKSYLENQENIE